MAAAWTGKLEKKDGRCRPARGDESWRKGNCPLAENTADRTVGGHSHRL